MTLLISTGIVTSLPLLSFVRSSQLLSLSTLGIFQYASPLLQFLSALMFFGESLSTTTLASFSLVWLAIISYLFGKRLAMKPLKNVRGSEMNQATFFTWLGIMALGGILALGPIRADASPQEIRVGGLFDLTGGGAIWGKSEKNAFMLGCQDFEASHPEFHVVPIIEDTLFSNRHTVTSLQKLISVNKVSYMVGATWENTVPMMSICEQKKVVCISPSYHGKEYYARPWRYNFSAWFDDRGYSSTLAEEIRAKGIKRVAVFAALTPYYDSLVEDLRARLSSSIIATERVTLEERDFKSIFMRISHDVDGVVMLLDNAGQIQAFLKQWSQLRDDRPPVFSDDLIAYLDPPDDIMRYGFRYLYATPVLEGEPYRDFVSRYTSVFHEAPTGPSAAVTYDETMLLLACAAKHSNTAGVRDCISTTNMYPGASGTISFNNGQTVRSRAMRIHQLTH